MVVPRRIRFGAFNKKNNMEWEYKQVKISIDFDGIFYFKIGSILYTERTLDGAKMVIDEKLKSYYLFSQKDMDRLMSKLDKKEQELVRSLYQEIEGHVGSAYCEQGISEKDWEWDWDFNK